MQGNERKRVGATGLIVAGNVRRLRVEKGWTPTILANRIAEIHQQHAAIFDGSEVELSESKLGKQAIAMIENGLRRVDVDDLVLIALAFDVSPTTLMIPEANTPADQVEMSTGSVSVEQWRWWLRGEAPLDTRLGELCIPASERGIEPSHLPGAVQVSVHEIERQHGIESSRQVVFEESQSQEWVRSISWVSELDYFNEPRSSFADDQPPV